MTGLSVFNFTFFALPAVTLPGTALKFRLTETIGLMEALFPPEDTSELNKLALDLPSKASTFAGMLNPVVARSVDGLVRSVNC